MLLQNYIFLFVVVDGFMIFKIEKKTNQKGI